MKNKNNQSTDNVVHKKEVEGYDIKYNDSVYTSKRYTEQYNLLP